MTYRFFSVFDRTSSFIRYIRYNTITQVKNYITGSYTICIS